ncbi:hypothetical protein BaRGS_00004771, partial [Batillaria attramentaria]
FVKMVRPAHQKDARQNCSDILPFSADFYAVVGSETLYFIYVDVVLTLVVWLLFVEECYFVLRTYKHYNIAIKSIWLISIYPFSALLLLYFGDGRKLLARIHDSGFTLRTRPLCCCCICCPVLPPTWRSLTCVRALIFQTVILMPAIQFIAAVLWADEQYSPHGIDFTDSYIYLTTLKVFSTITAIYGVNALHESTRLHLRTFNTAAKRVALVLVQVCFNLQDAILMLVARFDVLGCQHGFSSHLQMLEWHHLVLVVEMFLLSVFARLYYRQPLRLDAVLENRPGDIPVIYSSQVTKDHTLGNGWNGASNPVLNVNADRVVIFALDPKPSCTLTAGGDFCSDLDTYDTVETVEKATAQNDVTLV